MGNMSRTDKCQNVSSRENELENDSFVNLTKTSLSDKCLQMSCDMHVRFMHASHNISI